MRLNLILALVAGGLTLAGCKKKDPEPAPAAAAEAEPAKEEAPAVKKAEPKPEDDGPKTLSKPEEDEGDEGGDE